MRWYVFDTRTGGADYVLSTRWEWLARIVVRLNRNLDYWHDPRGL